MNSSDEIIGLDDTVDRLKERTKDDKKRVEDEKKRIEEREGIITALDAIRNEIHEIKENMIPTDNMIEFFDKIDKFLNEFSHIEDYSQDTNAKSKLHKAVEEARDTITKIRSWIKGD